MQSTEATASWSTVEGTLKVHCSNFEWSYHTCSSCSVPSQYPQCYSNCSSLIGTVSYETYIEGQEESGCVGFGYVTKYIYSNTSTLLYAFAS